MALPRRPHHPHRPHRPYGRLNIKRKRMKRRRILPEMDKPIPMHVVTEEVLTRLPAKSLMRFKCVSKLWSSLINSPYFKDRFLTVPTRQRPHIFMCLQDINDHRSAITLSLAPDTSISDTPSSSSFVVDHDLTIPQMSGGYIYQNLRGGFMCYNLWKKPRIFNPDTRQLVTLPRAFKPNKKNVCYYFGHDSVTDQYKVVCSVGTRLGNAQGVSSQHRVFVFKPEGGGGSWINAYPLPPDFVPHIAARGGVCIGGVIYYLGWTADDKCMLVSFGIRSHGFKMIQVPRAEELPPAKMKNVCLVEYGGKLTVVDQTNLRDKGMLDLLTVEDAANNKKWSSKTLVVKPTQRDLVKNCEFVVRGTSRNGKVFLIPMDLVSPFHILCYDLQSNDIRKIDIKGVPDHWFSKDKSTVEVMLVDHSETLMSLMNT